MGPEHKVWRLPDDADVCFGGNEKIKRAYEVAKDCHDEQFRKSGEPYISHCVEVLRILRNEWGIEDEDCMIACLLHDVVEDCEIGIDQINIEFGGGVAELVDGVTKLDAGNNMDTLKKVIKGSYLNPKVAVVKLADRLHNMRTLVFMPEDKQVKKASETLSVYARLAESLGMWVVKNELEDLCFKYVDRDEYLRVEAIIEEDPRLISFFSSNVSSGLEQLMTEHGYEGSVEMRRNGLYSLREKQKRQSLAGRCGDGFGEINDVVSARIRLSCVEDCYRLIGVIHRNYGEMVDYDRFDEFVGVNKRTNGYEAIQTTINFEQGPVEIAL